MTATPSVRLYSSARKEVKMREICTPYTIMLSILFSPALSNINLENLMYEDYNDDLDINYDTDNNETEYESFEGRQDQFVGETRPAHSSNQYHMATGSGHLHDFSGLFSYQKPHIPFPGKKKRKRGLKQKNFRYLIPLLLTALAKIAHFLPVVKLTLLALFALVLFSKKALLVSLGSLILVLYDTFYKGKHNNVGINLVKDRGSTVPTIDHGINAEDHHIEPAEGAWWERDEANTQKLNPRESPGEHWKKWWAPQVKYKPKKNGNEPSAVSSRRIKDKGILLDNLENVLYHIQY